MPTDSNYGEVPDAVLDVLRRADGPLRPSQIARVGHLNKNSVKSAVRRLAADGKLLSSEGAYTISPQAGGDPQKASMLGRHSPKYTVVAEGADRYGAAPARRAILVVLGFKGSPSIGWDMNASEWVPVGDPGYLDVDGKAELPV